MFLSEMLRTGSILVGFDFAFKKKGFIFIIYTEFTGQASLIKKSEIRFQKT